MGCSAYEHRRARAIWAAHHGPIPPGAHIHHRDGDWCNHAIENLECLTPRAHHQHHWRTRPLVPRHCAACGAAFLTRVAHATFCRNACKAKWRRDQRLDDETRACANCGDPFRVSRFNPGRFCSTACRQPGTYLRPTVTATCHHCGEPFAAQSLRAIWCSTRCRKRAGKVTANNA